LYQVLYRKWRPVTFAETVGQEHIAKTLLSQLQNNRLAHAYLFTGSRGTGKTTYAKILARAVNCERPVGGEPCNACPTCAGILNGSIPDVAEIDAASHSGVDNIRALRDEAAYTPVAARYRVYIIDEVHMLSTGAFNALLKTLEEPPPHVLFILATTETHKIPVTIASRCQRFAFRRISETDISAALERVCAHEGITIEPDALKLLSHMADGALRDALSLLEQCMVSGSRIREADVRETLGLSGMSDISDWLFGINDLSFSLNRMNKLYSAGLDFSSMLGQMSSMLRDLLMGQLTGDLLTTKLPPETASALSEQWPRPRIMQAISHIQESLNTISKTSDKRLETEMCLIRLASVGCEQTAETAYTKPVSSPPTPPPVPCEQSAQTPASEPVPEKKREKKPVPIHEKKQQPEQVTSVSPAAEPFVNAERDPRWMVFLTSLDTLHHNAVVKAKAEVNGDTLILRSEDPFMTGVLQSAEFSKSVAAFFPGGVTINGEKEQTNASPGKTLDAFLQEQNDLVIDE
jgi:DNA polymerase-3 subunit gamma/tau